MGKCRAEETDEKRTTFHRTKGKETQVQNLSFQSVHVCRYKGSMFRLRSHAVTHTEADRGGSRGS